MRHMSSQFSSCIPDPKGLTKSEWYEIVRSRIKQIFPNGLLRDGKLISEDELVARVKIVFFRHVAADSQPSREAKCMMLQLLDDCLDWNEGNYSRAKRPRGSDDGVISPKPWATDDFPPSLEVIANERVETDPVR